MLEELDFSELDWLEIVLVIVQCYGIDVYEQLVLFEWLEDVLDILLQDVFQGDSFSMSSLLLYDILWEVEFYFLFNVVKCYVFSKVFVEYRVVVFE